jgi:hypothetical protein
MEVRQPKTRPNYQQAVCEKKSSQPRHLLSSYFSSGSYGKELASNLKHAHRFLLRHLLFEATYFLFG